MCLAVKLGLTEKKMGITTRISAPSGPVAASCPKLIESTETTILPAAMASSSSGVRSWRTAFLTLRDETLASPPASALQSLIRDLVLSQSTEDLAAAAVDLPPHEVTETLTLTIVSLIIGRKSSFFSGDELFKWRLGYFGCDSPGGAGAGDFQLQGCGRWPNTTAYLRSGNL